MVQIIAGVRGSGKTKKMVDRANGDVRTADGSIVYVDKSSQHMLELNSRIRLVDMKEFTVIGTTDAFLGFLSGMISQNSDIQKIYLDSFLTVAHIETDEEFVRAIRILDTVSAKFSADFILSVSKNPQDFAEELQGMLIND